MPPLAPICVSLGSNIDPHFNLSQAVRLLDSAVEIVGVSSVYQAQPVDAPNTPTFLNAAVAVETKQEPLSLKTEVLRPIEAQLGRKRTADRNAPRTIDLDLTFYHDRVIRDVDRALIVPDPESLIRAHIALPLADLAPGALHPLSGQTLKEIAQQFESDGGIRIYRKLRLEDLLR